MSKIVQFIVISAIVLLSGGCSNSPLLQGAAGKNLDLSGYFMQGEVEAVNPETALPQGRLIVGRINYKSRKVSIPADHKVPNTGSFKAVRTESLLGTSEVSIEYDFTADGNESAQMLHNSLTGQTQAAAAWLAAPAGN